MLLGSLLGFIGALTYSLRNSYTKDLAAFNISKNSINFYSRLFCIPLILIATLFTEVNWYNFKDGFIFYTTIAIVIISVAIYYQVYIFQTQNFATVESLYFLNVIFTTLGGIIFFNEILSTKQYIGIAIVCIAYIELYIRKKHDLKLSDLAKIVGLFLIYSATDLANKAAIIRTDPIVFTLVTLVAITIIAFISAVISKQEIYKLNDPKANKILIIMAIISAISYIAINFGYKLLPVGILSTILSTKTFMSLFLSYKKYNMKDLKYYIKCSIIAFIGVILIFI